MRYVLYLLLSLLIIFNDLFQSFQVLPQNAHLLLTVLFQSCLQTLTLASFQQTDILLILNHDNVQRTFLGSQRLTFPSDCLPLLCLASATIC